MILGGKLKHAKDFYFSMMFSLSTTLMNFVDELIEDREKEHKSKSMEQSFLDSRKKPVFTQGSN